MFKLKVNTHGPEAVNMDDMRVGQIGKLIDHLGMAGETVMRTNYNYVMILDDPLSDNGWSGKTGLKVRLLEPGDSVTLTVQ